MTGIAIVLGFRNDFNIKCCGARQVVRKVGVMPTSSELVQDKCEKREHRASGGLYGWCCGRINTNSKTASQATEAGLAAQCIKINCL
jgi:hypothetical protein